MKKIAALPFILGIQFILALSILVGWGWATRASAAEISGVSFDEKKQVHGADLVLNGVGLRTVTRFGFNIKVYVAAFYAPKKIDAVEKLKDEKQPQQIVMHFLHAVDRDSLIETFDSSFKGNCLYDCDKKSEQFALLKQHLVSVRKGDRMIFTRHGGKLTFEVVGANAKKVDLDGEARAQNLFAMFLHDKQPPSPELRKSLLGIR